MLDSIIKLVKNEAFNLIANDVNVPQEKQNDVVETTSTSIIEGLKSQFSLKNIGAITKLFRVEEPVSTSTIVKNIQEIVIDALTQKTGLNKGIASSISLSVVPAVFQIISDKVNDPDDSEFNIKSLISSFTVNSAGDVLGFVKGLFGK